MHVMFLLPLLLSACLVSARSSRNSVKRAKSPNFVSTSGGKFHVNGRYDLYASTTVYSQEGSFIISINSSEFQFIGTNAYWLSTLNTDKDISDTFHSMSAAGIKVVRTWGFNGAAPDIQSTDNHIDFECRCSRDTQKRNMVSAHF
jgi:hypothetical protein